MSRVSGDSVNIGQDKFKTLVGLAHDLQIPLKFMHDASYYIANNYDKLTKKQIVEYLEKINVQTEGFMHLIDGIVKGYNLNQSKFKLNIEPTNLFLLANDATEELQVTARHYGQLLDVKSSKKLPMALVDKQALSLAIYNIVEMVLKYSPTESLICLKLSKKASQLKLSLRASSLYITKKEIIRILQEFSKLRSPSRTFASNSGIGVFVAKNIIEGMDGELEINKSRSGCNFNIYLPISDQQPLFNLETYSL